jgi:hypothetical protein
MRIIVLAFCSLSLLGSVVEPEPEPQLLALAEPEKGLGSRSNIKYNKKVKNQK